MAPSPPSGAENDDDRASGHRPFWLELLAPQPANVLILLDSSQSMAERAYPGTTLSRLDAAKIAVRRALVRLDPEDHVGAWAITTRRSTTPTHRELGPVAALGPPGGRRNRLIDQVDVLRPEGGTPLDAAVGDAYDTVRRGGRGDTINAVLVLSDGQDSGPGTPTLDAVIDRIRAAYGTDRATGKQVRVLGVWYRRPTDPPDPPKGLSLTRMTAATGGVLVGATSRTIEGVLDEVISDF